MERFIGIDVHKDSSTVAVMGPSGKKIRCDVVETNGAVLVEMMKQIPGKRHLCIEETLTAPGFGPIRAAQVLAFAMTPHRFRTTRQFWSYCGLSIVMRTSSDWVRENGRWIRSDNAMKTRGLTCRRQPVLKNVFKGAAHTVVGKMKEHPLARKYQQMCEAGTKPSLAMLTIARKIAGAVFAMWKHEEDYDPERQVRRPPPA
jgi:transposase